MSDALDELLKQGIISKEDHASGIRLRWLYTILFGSPDVSAYPDGWPHGYDNIVKELTRNGVKTMMLNVCIFNTATKRVKDLSKGFNILKRYAKETDSE